VILIQNSDKCIKNNLNKKFFKIILFFKNIFFPDRATVKISSMFQADYKVRDGAKLEMELVIACSIMAKNKNQQYF
jgi:hypothetical protein